MHTESHEKAGETVSLTLNGEVVEYRIEDWWDKLTGKSWMFSDRNPAAIGYAFRAGTKGLPIDDEVVYGKVGSIGHLAHVSELL